MIFTNDILIKIAVFVLGAVGFWVARHIRHSKTKNKPLVCLVGFDCHAVVTSDYSRFMGVPLEILGMFYYGLMSLAYLGLIFIPGILPTFMVNIVVLGSLAAFLFSLYLIIVQVFILKKGCSWCFVSAGISITIFVLNFIVYDFLWILLGF